MSESELVYIGIDGGASKTSVAIEYRGDIIGRAAAGSANIAVSVEQSWDSIEAGISRALSGSGISLGQERLRFILAAGVAGTEIDSAVSRFRAHQSCALFEDVVIASDGYVACLGAHDGRDGGIVNIGTGIVGYQVLSGDIQRLSGWGFPLADKGSGAWVGLQAIRSALHWFDGRKPMSPLIDAIASQFDRDSSQLLEAANAGTSSWYARFAPVVIQSAAQGDETAADIVREAASEVLAIILAMRKLTKETLPIALVGGLAGAIAQYLPSDCRDSLVEAHADAAIGALYLAKSEKNKLK